ncbi:hypothetical protein DFH11DRAFT_98230 [Phellopilus nigrolimitatus]|nr:hypothetical protein DFH11DRAFT_98230 [Phellopilus nigrolimitatus]
MRFSAPRPRFTLGLGALIHLPPSLRTCVLSPRSQHMQIIHPNNTRCTCIHLISPPSVSSRLVAAWHGRPVRNQRASAGPDARTVRPWPVPGAALSSHLDSALLKSAQLCTYLCICIQT